MEDPVFSKNCGHSFEASAIKGWLKKHDSCPKCHTPLTENDLMKNYNLKNTIEYMKQQQKALLAKQADPDQKVLN
jgi:HRD ubiquitin ligase complex, ER membrane component